MSHRIAVPVALLLAAAGVAVLARVTSVSGKDVVRDPAAPAAPTSAPAGPLAFVMKDIDGKDVNLADYRGKVVMIVNVASRCGFTPQYAGLERVYKQYADQGFVVLGFPANNFKGQEPGSDEEIKQFCTAKYNVTFPIMSKISVKGDDIHPLYRTLTSADTNGEFAGDIAWNFNKFLVDRTGRVYARFESKTTPEDATVKAAIEKGLAAK